MADKIDFKREVGAYRARERVCSRSWVPDWIDQGMFAGVVEQFTADDRPRRLNEVRLNTLSEGRCVQTLHVGSYEDEAGVLDRMHHEFVPDNALRMVGRHHEIYLSDARKVSPEKLRTILRQPVSAADSAG